MLIRLLDSPKLFGSFAPSSIAQSRFPKGSLSPDGPPFLFMPHRGGGEHGVGFCWKVTACQFSKTPPLFGCLPQGAFARQLLH